MTNDEQETIDSTNDTELEDNNTDNESRTDDEESSEESEVEDGDNSEDSDSVTFTREELAKRDKEIRKSQDERWKSRLKEGGKESDSKEGKVVSNSELVERTYLAANGYKDKDVQNEIMRLAKKFDMQVNDALDDFDIKQRADSLMKKKEAAKAVAKSTGGATSSKKTPQNVADYFREKGDFPSYATQEMIAKATDILAKG